MKLYVAVGAQMGRFPGNFGHPRSRSAKMAQEKLTFFVREIVRKMASKCQFSAADLHENWRQHLNWCRHQFFQKRIVEFFQKRVIYLQKRLFEVCFSGCLVFSLQTNWWGSESEWTFCLIEQDADDDALLCLCDTTLAVRPSALHLVRQQTSPSFPTSHRYLPCSVCRPVSYQWLQAPLEWRSRWICARLLCCICNGLLTASRTLARLYVVVIKLCFRFF